MLQFSIDSLEPGMVIGKPIYNQDGKLLLGKGIPLNEFFIRKLKKKGIVSLYVFDEDTEDVAPQESISDMVRGSTLKDLRAVFGPLEDLAREVKTESYQAVMESISSERYKKTFKENPAFKKIVNDAGSIVDELINGDLTLGLSSIKTYDNYTFQHSIDVSIVSIMIGRKLGLERKRLRELAVGCLLHDIGKTFVPIDILNKEGKLTDEEFRRIKDHPVFGFELTKDVVTIGILPPHVALQHHEKQDGSGYPRGLTGDNRLTISGEKMIHLYGSIAAVADVYDALSSDRPYRKGYPPEKVIKIMRDMQTTHLNHEVLRHFLSITPVYPKGSTIRVTTGDYKYYLGVVTEVNMQYLDRPSIRLLVDRNRKKINPVDLDLAADESLHIESILL